MAMRVPDKHGIMFEKNFSMWKESIMVHLKIPELGQVIPMELLCCICISASNAGVLPSSSMAKLSVALASQHQSATEATCS